MSASMSDLPHERTDACSCEPLADTWGTVMGWRNMCDEHRAILDRFHAETLRRLERPDPVPVTPAEPAGQRDRAGSRADTEEPFVCPDCRASTWLCICVRNSENVRLRAALDRQAAVVSAARALVEQLDHSPSWKFGAGITAETRGQMHVLARAVRALDGEQ